jgi:hypothetical protein
VTKRVFQIILILFLSGMMATSCKTTSRSEKYYEKEGEKKDAEVQKNYEETVKKHVDVQSKGTQKQMRELNKQSKKLNKSRKPKLKKC